MSLLHTPTDSEQRRAAREDSILRGAEASHHLATVMLTEHSKFWASDPVQLVEDLNADLAASLSLMGTNSMLAQAVNASLDTLALAQFSRRAPTSMPHGWAFDGKAFSYTPPPPPEVFGGLTKAVG